MVHRPDAALAGRRTGPNMILDDGGDATLLVHKGVRVREGRRGAGRRATADSEEYAVILDLLRRIARRRPEHVHRDGRGHQGRHRGDHHRRAPALPDVRQGRHAALPGDQRQRLGDQEQVRQQVRLPALADRRHQPRHRRADRRQGRGRLSATATSARAAPSRCAARAPASSSPRSTRSARCRRRWTATRSPRSTTSIETADIFITATGNKDIITAERHGQMKHQAIVGNIGHFDNEIDMAGLAKLRASSQDRDQAAGRRVAFADGHSIIVLSEGRLLNLGNATGHPSFVMSNVVLQPGHRADRAVHQARRLRRRRSTCCPSTWTRRSPGSTSTRWACELTELTKDQAEYIGVDVEGPYKPDHYRY